jgi:hypothetical protein
MTAIAPEGTRTVQPPLGAEPGPREPISARATIASTVEERRRIIAKRVRELTNELRSLVFEDATLAAHEIVSGVGQEGE